MGRPTSALDVVEASTAMCAPCATGSSSTSPTRAMEHDRGGIAIGFEDPSDRFSEFGVNIRVHQPGRPSGKDHGESVQEDFLVLAASRRPTPRRSTPTGSGRSRR
jgi:hypothetical protein